MKVPTLRDIITEDPRITWIDTAGDAWDAATILTEWGPELDREANCTGGRIHLIGPDGYFNPNDEPILRTEHKEA